MNIFLYGFGFITLFVTVSVGRCDTFTHRQSGQVYHGFATQTVNANGRTLVRTTEKGEIELVMGEYAVEYNYQGRNNTVPVISIDGGIISDLETAGFEQAMVEESNKGPLFILLEFNKADGLSYFIKRIVAAIEKTSNCKVIGLVEINEEGGVCGTGIAPVLACNEIYMITDSNLKPGRSKDMVIVPVSKNLPADDPIHNEFGRKLHDSPAWHDYIATVARNHKRPELMARAFFDASVELHEIKRDGKRLYVTPAQKKKTDELVSVLTNSGSCLILTAENALAAGMTDGIVGNRDELFKKLTVRPETVSQNNQMQTGRKKYNVLLDKCEKDIEMINEKITVINSQVDSAVLDKTVRMRTLKELKFVMQKTQALIKLKEQYPDLIFTDEEMKKTLSSYKNIYDQLRAIL